MLCAFEHALQTIYYIAFFFAVYGLPDHYTAKVMLYYSLCCNSNMITNLPYALVVIVIQMRCTARSNTNLR